MDELDMRILTCLRENARMTASAIGSLVSLSVSAVSERIKRMEKAGIIRGYTAIVSPAHMGRDVCAFICVSLSHARHNESFMRAARAHPDIDTCQYVTGDFDFIVKVAVDSTRSLERVLTEVRAMGGVSFTRTLVVLKSVKEDMPGMPENESDAEKGGTETC